MNGNEFPVSSLQGRLMKKYDTINTRDIEAMSNASCHMNGSMIEMAKYSDPRVTAGIIAKIEEYCRRRKDFIAEHGDLMSILVGKYPSRSDPNAYYYISTDPYDIFTKSTGRSWSVRNCERIFGSSQQGIYSDIEHNSAVVFIKDKRLKGFKSAVARLELQLCIMDGKEHEIDPMKKYSIGWAINWYRGDHTHERHHIYKEDALMRPLNLTGNRARIELLEIIHAAGFNVGYKTCTTPFVHGGFSDVESAPNTATTFQSDYEHRCANCGIPERGDQMVSIRHDGSTVEVCKFCNGHRQAGYIFDGGRN